MRRDEPGSATQSAGQAAEVARLACADLGLVCHGRRGRPAARPARSRYGSDVERREGREAKRQRQGSDAKGRRRCEDARQAATKATGPEAAAAGTTATGATAAGSTAASRPEGRQTWNESTRLQSE